VNSEETVNQMNIDFNNNCLNTNIVANKNKDPLKENIENTEIKENKLNE